MEATYKYNWELLTEILTYRFIIKNVEYINNRQATMSHDVDMRYFFKNYFLIVLTWLFYDFIAWRISYLSSNFPAPR